MTHTKYLQIQNSISCQALLAIGKLRWWELREAVPIAKNTIEQLHEVENPNEREPSEIQAEDLQETVERFKKEIDNCSKLLSTKNRDINQLNYKIRELNETIGKQNQEISEWIAQSDRQRTMSEELSERNEELRTQLDGYKTKFAETLDSLNKANLALAKPAPGTTAQLVNLILKVNNAVILLLTSQGDWGRLIRRAIDHPLPGMWVHETSRFRKSNPLEGFGRLIVMRDETRYSPNPDDEKLQIASRDTFWYIETLDGSLERWANCTFAGLPLLTKGVNGSVLLEDDTAWALEARKRHEIDKQAELPIVKESSDEAKEV